MDPTEEEKQALAQQEEFERRLFSDDDLSVISCISVTKAGHGHLDRSGVPKQYFLVLTVNKNDNRDCKLHTVKIKYQNNDLALQKSPKINKLKWFEISRNINDKNAGKHSQSQYDFKLHWKNGSNESFDLSPNSLRTVNLFAFILYNVSAYTSSQKHIILLSPYELVELEVFGREYLDRIFNNSQLFNRISSIQQDIFTPIYKRLSSQILVDITIDNTKDDINGKKRRLSMRNDGNNDNDDGSKSFDVPLMTDDETKNIKKYIADCNLSIDNIHLLESKLMEKQREIMKENIDAFKNNENDIDKLITNIQGTIDDVKDLQQSLQKYKRHINKMASGVNQIKKKNQTLAIQDTNMEKLRETLKDVINQLTLHPKYEQTLKNPSFDTNDEYNRSLKAAEILSSKLNLKFKDGLEQMLAVKKQREHFRELKTRFCSEASIYFDKLFVRNSRIRDKYDIPKNKYQKQTFIYVHTKQHKNLFKYYELLQYICNLHVDKYESITLDYQKSFSKLYINEFKNYFNYINKTIYNEQKDNSMITFPTFNLSSLLNRSIDDAELSQSTASTIFTKQSSIPQTNSSMINNHNNSDNNNNNNISSMPTINEDISDQNKNKITKVYRQSLMEILPIIITEKKFLLKYFEFINDEQKTEKVVERILKSFFLNLESQFISLIDKADSMNNFNTLEMLIISERALHCYRDYGSFLASLLSKLHTKLTLNWNKFISDEIDWIKSQKISIKQAGVLLPIQKFPAFCNEMYKVVSFGDEKSKEITDIDKLIPKTDYLSNNDQKSDAAYPKQQQPQPVAVLVNNNPFNDIVFTESEQVTNTIHKMTTMAFHWLDKAAKTDPKYTSVCLMENYHYFYTIFSKTESLRAIREHVRKAHKHYNNARRSYVKWCVRYECKALTDFWDDFEQKVLTDKETVSVYISSSKVKSICAEYIDSEKKIKKFIDGMFKRLKKHLGQNDILFKKIWKKIADYFCDKYKKFKENIEIIYSVNQTDKKFLKYEYEFIYNSFVAQYQNAFGNGSNFDDDNSSLGSTSIGASSMVSGITSYSTYSTYSAKMKDKQNKAKKGLSRFKRNSKKKLTNPSFSPTKSNPY